MKPKPNNYKDFAQECEGYWGSEEDKITKAANAEQIWRRFALELIDIIRFNKVKNATNFEKEIPEAFERAVK